MVLALCRRCMVVPILRCLHLGCLNSVGENQKNNEAGRGDNPRPVSSLSPLSIGVKGVCPVCGEGNLFKGLLDLQDSCEVCGFDMAEADPADGPAVFVILILGALVTIGMFILEFKIKVTSSSMPDF